MITTVLPCGLLTTAGLPFHTTFPAPLPTAWTAQSILPDHGGLLELHLHSRDDGITTRRSAVSCWRLGATCCPDIIAGNQMAFTGLDPGSRLNATRIMPAREDQGIAWRVTVQVLLTCSCYDLPLRVGTGGEPA